MIARASATGDPRFPRAKLAVAGGKVFEAREPRESGKCSECPLVAALSTAWGPSRPLKKSKGSVAEIPETASGVEQKYA